MKVITIEEPTFDRIFTDFERELGLAKYESLEYIPNDRPLDRQELYDAHRKWIYQLHRLKDRLRSER